jgi:anhydro-N-acetylmuramic acid kinase
MRSWTVIGLMSGTSTDGVDAALVRLRPRRAGYRVEGVVFRTYPFPAPLRRKLLAAAEGTPRPAADFSRLNFELGHVFAGATLRLLQAARTAPAAVDLIGSHGHTIFHGPWGQQRGTPSTWQIGEPAVIAARTGITTVADFRPADVAHGGQGAPLVPYVHWLLFRHARRGRAINNIGGISNITFLRAAAGVRDVIAFDAGPGTMIIDAVTTRVTGGHRRYDHAGRLAQAGQVDEMGVRELMRHPFLRRRPPKSTGREEFGAAMVDRLFAAARRRRLTAADLVATATAFTARALGDAYRRFVLPLGRVDEVYVCGGGGRNPVLLAMLANELPFARVAAVDHLGIDGDALEAVAFAVLGVEAVRGKCANLPRVTGAKTATVLGKVVPGWAETFSRLFRPRR